MSDCPLICPKKNIRHFALKSIAKDPTEGRTLFGQISMLRRCVGRRGRILDAVALQSGHQRWGRPINGVWRHRTRGDVRTGGRA